MAHDQGGWRDSGPHSSRGSQESNEARGRSSAFDDSAENSVAVHLAGERGRRCAGEFMARWATLSFMALGLGLSSGPAPPDDAGLPIFCDWSEWNNTKLILYSVNTLLQPAGDSLVSSRCLVLVKSAVYIYK